MQAQSSALDKQTTLLRTPDEISSQLRALAAELVSSGAPVYVPIRPVIGGTVDECFANVHTVVQRNGGQRLLGWSLWEWPNVMIEAAFHAVWQSPGGELIDISPRNDDETRVLFLPDSKREYKGQAVNTERRPLLDDPFVRELIRVADETFAVLNKGDRAFQNGSVTLPKEEILPLIARKQILMHILRNRPVSRNAPCICGADKKFKKCCAIPVF